MFKSENCIGFYFKASSQLSNKLLFFFNPLDPDDVVKKKNGLVVGDVNMQLQKIWLRGKGKEVYHENFGWRPG